MTKKALIIMFIIFFSNNAISSEIVVSVKPLHSLVSAVAEGSHSVSLLIDGGMSPHNFALKPSHAKLLPESEVDFVGSGALPSLTSNSLTPCKRLLMMC